MSSPAIGVRRGLLPANARVDWSHPLAQGLQFYGVPGLGFDLAKYRRFTSTVGANKLTKYGRTTDVNWTIANTSDLAFTSGPYTVAIAGNRADDSNMASFGRFLFNSDGDNQGWVLRYYTTAPIGWTLTTYRNNARANTACTSSFTSVVGDYVVVGTSNGTNERRIYIDGLLGASVSTNVNPLSVTTGSMFIGTGSGFGSQPATIGAAWNRCLFENDVAMFSANPYCLLRY